MLNRMPINRMKQAVKQFIAAALVITLLVPAIASLLPHDALNVLHSQQEASHHGSSVLNHHNDAFEVSSNKAHEAHFDIFAYFDQLHIDLKQPSAAKSFSAPATLDNIAIIPENTFAAVSSIYSTQNKADWPPSGYHSTAFNTPVYLATQRLRI